MLLVTQNRAEIIATGNKGHILVYQLKENALKLDAQQPDYAQCTGGGVTTLTFVFKSVDDATSVYTQSTTKRRR